MVIRLHDSVKIQKARDIVAGREKGAVHVMGKVVKAPAFYNPGWSFHLDPNSVSFFEMAVEVCDGTVASVEENLASIGGSLFPNSVFCGWSSLVTKELQAPAKADQYITNVSAASYSGLALAPGSIASAFGSGLAPEAVGASELPLPASLGGVSVQVKDSAGTEREASLYYVSPAQVNYVVPEGLASGVATVTLTTSARGAVTEQVYIQPAAPALFSADGRAGGVAAGWVYRLRADGTGSYEPVAKVQPDTQLVVPEPVDIGAEGEEVYLSLLGTGLRGHPGMEFVRVHFEGIPGTVVYAGVQGVSPGVDQINIKLPGEVRGLGEVTAVVSVEYPDRFLESNSVRVAFR